MWKSMKIRRNKKTIRKDFLYRYWENKTSANVGAVRLWQAEKRLRKKKAANREGTLSKAGLSPPLGKYDGKEEQKARLVDRNVNAKHFGEGRREAIRRIKKQRILEESGEAGGEECNDLYEGHKASTTQWQDAASQHSSRSFCLTDNRCHYINCWKTATWWVQIFYNIDMINRW